MTDRTVAGKLNNAYRWVSRGCNALDSMPKNLLKRVESRFAFPSMVTATGDSIPIFAPLLAISTTDYLSTAKQIGIQQTLDALAANINIDERANKLPLEKLVSYAQKLLALKSTNEAKDSHEIMLALLDALGIISDKLELRKDYHTPEVASSVVSNKLLFSQEYRLRRAIKNKDWTDIFTILSGRNLDAPKQQEFYGERQNNLYSALLEGLFQEAFSKIAVDVIASSGLVDFCKKIESIGSEKEKEKLAKLKRTFAHSLWVDMLSGKTGIPQKSAISYIYSLIPDFVVSHVLKLAEAFPGEQARQLQDILISVEPRPLKEIAKAATSKQMEGLMLAAIRVKEERKQEASRHGDKVRAELLATADEVLGKLYKASSLDRLADTALESPEQIGHKLFINLADLVKYDKGSVLDKLMEKINGKNSSFKIFLGGLSEPGIQIPSILSRFNDKVFAAVIKEAFSYDANQKDDPFIFILTAVNSSPSLLDEIAKVIKTLGVEKNALARVANHPNAAAALLARVDIE